MLRTFGRVSSQMRRMAGDFRRQFDEALKEAELEELRQTARDVREMDPRNDLRKAMNPIRAVGDEIRSSIKAAAEAPQPTVPSATQSAIPMETPLVTEPAASGPSPNGEAHSQAEANGSSIHIPAEKAAVHDQAASRAPVGGVQ